MIKNRHNGFTMVELILYIGLLSMMLIMLTSIFSTSLDLQLESRSTSTLDQDARFLISRLSYDALRAASITAPASIGTSDALLALVIDGDTYTYSVSNGNLILTNTQGSDQLNGYDTTISSISFQRLGNANGKNSIQMIVTLASKTELAKGTESKTITTTLGTR